MAISAAVLRILEDWGQYRRLSVSPRLGYPSATAETKAGEGKGGGPYRQVLVRDPPPPAFELVEGALSGLTPFENAVLELRYVAGVREVALRNGQKQTLKRAESKVLRALNEESIT